MIDEFNVDYRDFLNENNNIKSNSKRKINTKPLIKSSFKDDKTDDPRGFEESDIFVFKKKYRLFLGSFFLILALGCVIFTSFCFQGPQIKECFEKITNICFKS
ncbi:MAG: hypothetical protein LBI55_04030 [Oscillospiraceae bacterium]|jgi:hypothetical protein|nr:hypothetical protein [Oscillospiraceae bacterium]